MSELDYEAEFKQMIAKHMGIVFLSGWLPIPGASSGMELYAEKEMLKFAKEKFLPSLQQPEEEQIMRFFKRKRFFLRTMEIIPYAGAVLSVVHIYGKGHYLMEIAKKPISFADPNLLKASLEELWTDFEHVLWDGNHMTQFYEDISKQTLSPKIKEHFSTILEKMETQYNATLVKNPKIHELQDKGEELVHNTVQTAKSTATKLFNKWFS